MPEQIAVWMMLLLLPWEITAVHNADIPALQKQLIQLEKDTQAYRQKKCGCGL